MKSKNIVKNIIMAIITTVVVTSMVVFDTVNVKAAEGDLYGDSSGLQDLTFEEFCENPGAHINYGEISWVIPHESDFGPGSGQKKKWARAFHNKEWDKIVEAANKGIHHPVTWTYTADGWNIPLIDKFLYIQKSDVTMAGRIYNFFVPLGIVLLVMYMLIDMLNLFTNRTREFDLKQLLICIFKALLGLVLLKYMPMILESLINAANACVGAIYNGTISFSVTSGSMKRGNYYIILCTVICMLNFMECIGIIVNVPLIMVCSIVPQIIIGFQAASRKVEIIIRMGLIPISCIDVYNGLANSNCLRYLKKLAACMLYGFVMMAIIRITFALQQADGQAMFMDMCLAMQRAGTNGGSLGAMLPSVASILESLLYSFVAVGLVTSSKQIVNEAVGS